MGSSVEAKDIGVELDINTRIEIVFKSLTNVFVGFRVAYSLGNNALTLPQLMKELQYYELMLNGGKLVQEKVKIPNTTQTSTNSSNNFEGANIRFRDADDKEIASNSSNLDDSIVAVDKASEYVSMGEPDISFFGCDGEDDKTNADYYFDSYSHFGIHEEMLKDVVRTKTYQNVIYRNKFLFQNKVVLDVGAGTEILSLFCAKAGAAHVYAVECSHMADMAKQIVETNGLPDGEVFKIVVSSCIASCGWGQLATLLVKFSVACYDLQKVDDGVVLPDEASLYLTAIEDAEYKDDKIECEYNRLLN
ncbi:protein arginine N-methyltransferase 1.1-like [Gossypium hirsutum]|uniref:Protein arginine N-methyltransferase 1.1-like n=1 Tax=Gossypium hirsutum TaxID=3635 RepID=A0ABM3A839_GOSHI|nr:protein arginine N-methyltransferase 1.1-like [Gossypium hirsutum]